MSLCSTGSLPLHYHWQCCQSSGKLKWLTTLKIFGPSGKSSSSIACLLCYPIRQDKFGSRQEVFSQPYALAQNLKSLGQISSRSYVTFQVTQPHYAQQFFPFQDQNTTMSKEDPKGYSNEGNT